MFERSTAGRVGQLVLAALSGYAALFAASTAVLFGIAALRHYPLSLQFNVVLTTSAIDATAKIITPAGLFLSQIAGEAATLFAVALWLRRSARMQQFLGRPHWGDLGFGLMAAGGLLVLAEVIGIIEYVLHAVHGSPTQIAFVGAIGSPLLLLLIAAVAGFAEELTFRGYLLRSLLRLLPRQIWLAVLVESALFALYHLGWGLAPGPFLVIFALGIALSVLALRANLYIAMIAHAAYDGLGFLVALHLH